MANNNIITVDVLTSVLSAFKDSLKDTTTDNTTSVIEPNVDDLPVVFITGNIPTSKTYVDGELEYISKTSTFKAYTKIKLQGNSSLSNPKQNFTVELYSNETRTAYLNKQFKDWPRAHTFTLKADYIDILHVRNIIAAKLWGKMVQTRSDFDSLPTELKSSPNFGAAAGFPIKVYINGTYAGIYNFTTYKKNMFGMDDSNAKYAVLQAQYNDNGSTDRQYNPCNFNQGWDGSETYWDIEIGSDTDSIINAFENLVPDIDSVSASANYYNLNSLLDYIIFQDVILGTDGLAKNMMLLNYDLTNPVWHFSPWDLDSTFDLSWEGILLGKSNVSLFSANGDVTVDDCYENKFSSLLTKISGAYFSEYKIRYAELRNGPLSHASIMGEFEKYLGIYGEDLCIKDTINYPDIPSATENNLQYLNNFIVKHLEYLDSKYL